MAKEIKLSIRTLVEFVMRHGSIDNRYVSSIRAIEGTRAHQKIQKSYKENYYAEIPLKYKMKYDDIDILIEGRADGILINDNNVIIDEIKTTLKDVLEIDENYNPLHWAQAKCYAFIYAKEKGLENIDVQITYYNIETMAIKYLTKTYTIDELECFFLRLIDDYKFWADLEFRWIDKRNDSIKNLSFPFESYRKGQRELAVRVYKSIVEEKKCFAQAPTGIGKTISTLFPAIKAMGEGHTSKIFYLTAKTITRDVAESSINLMRDKGLMFKSVTITAKDKVCKMEEVKCNPEYCPYANGYYDRINTALKNIILEDMEYNRSNIDMLSEKYKLCPFELSLDLTPWCDAIICDYNYLFDPKVYLKRFFDVRLTDYIFLIDEAHNLVDRGREMYSATLNKSDILKIKKAMGKKDKGVSNALNRINTYFISKKKVLEEIEQNYMVDEAEPIEIYSLLRIFIERCDGFLSKNKDENKELMDLYFNIHTFLSISEFYDENYITLYEKENDDLIMKIYCVDPSKVLQDRMKKGKSTIIFSATLLPMEYFKNIYGANENDYFINLSSPFDTKNRLILIGDRIITTYSKREETCREIIEYIVQCIKVKKGNYMVFFPSYKYMNLVFQQFKEDYPDISVKMQETNMSELEKEEFVLCFDSENLDTHIGFCVLGGHFSEGIDLTNDKLIGVIIIGVGMPQIGAHRDIIKNHFNKNDDRGFDYAYIFPGIIKVLQAAGRCIRTEEDRGIIMLLDSRYKEYRYKKLFPSEWFPNYTVRKSDDVKNLCNKFWNE